MNLRLPLLALIALLPLTASANASYFIDFGDNYSTTDPGWTLAPNTAANDMSSVSLLNEAGAASGITFSFTVPADGTSTTGATTLSGDASIFTVASSRDFFYKNNTAMEITFSGLDTSVPYAFTYFGSRSATDDRLVDYTLSNGTNSSNVTLAVSSAAGANTSNIVTSSGLMPSPSGTLTVSIAPNENSDSTFAYINAMRITEVPEPSTYAVILGALALTIGLLRRRQR